MVCIKSSAHLRVPTVLHSPSPMASENVGTIST
jgi:hypothetical protein